MRRCNFATLLLVPVLYGRRILALELLKNPIGNAR
jgi:hypothetical protein